MKSKLLHKIENREIIVGVIGLGYVGLPLAVEKAKAGFKTIGFDVQKEKVDLVNTGHNYIGDVVDSDLKKLVDAGTLSATTDFSFVKDVDFIAICVPTPLDAHQQPDISFVRASTTEVAKYLTRETMVVLESTTYPGTTEELIKPILEEGSGLKCGKDFYLGFSPERVDPGNLIYKTKNTPKVVGAIGKDATEVIASMYRAVLEGDVYEVSSPAIAEMEKTVLNAGWDGEWFLRAYDHYKNKIGSKECEDGKIFIEPQGFCVMAEIGLKEGNCLKAMESVEKYLDTKYGIVLLQPPYHRYHVELGEISSYPPGYKENAGIFCHNNPWISIAETVVGRGNRAWQVYTRTCPAYIEDISEIHRTEPYVYSQMIAGKDAPNFGEAKNSWLTGTAAWTFLDVSQYILGIRPDYDGLTVDPCIPSTLDGFEAKRDFRGVTYHISVRNPKHVEKGVASMTVDGIAVDGNTIPLPTGKTEVSVEVVMG